MSARRAPLIRRPLAAGAAASAAPSAASERGTPVAPIRAAFAEATWVR